jgi:hypothetical protein
MTVIKLEKGEWQRFFDFLSRGLEGARAEIEVASLSLGNQVEAEWLPLFGITYDPKDDLIEVALENYDHMIAHPREVYLDATTGELMSLEVVDAEGVRQIVKLREPFLLPPPRPQGAERQTQR